MTPLNLPVGSVRAILTILLVGLCGLMLFVPVVEGADDVRGMFILLTGIAVRDYFASRGSAEPAGGIAVG